MCRDASEGMPEALAYRLERPAFVEAFKAVQHTLICRSIGDANVYNAYFEKQCSEQNAQALALRASLDKLTQLDEVVNDLVKHYLSMTHGKCQILLDILSGIDTFDMRVFNGFAVCAIDGVIVHTGMCMQDKQTNVSFVISHKFKFAAHVAHRAAEALGVDAQALLHDAGSVGHVPHMHFPRHAPSSRLRNLHLRMLQIL